MKEALELFQDMKAVVVIQLQTGILYTGFVIATGKSHIRFTVDTGCEMFISIPHIMTVYAKKSCK